MIEPARIHPTAIVEAGAEVGAGTSIWDHAHVRAGAVVGRECIVGEKTYLASGVRVGDRVKINAAVYIPFGITIEDGVMIAAHVVFTNDKNPRATDPDLARLQTSAPTEATLRCLVERGASIGANATIGPGLVLGAYCMVGMGAVVTRDVPPHGLVVGNPARLVALVARDGSVVRTIEDGALPRNARIACPGDGALVIAEGTVRHVSA